MVEVKDVAKYILSQSEPEIGDIISQLKLQKLLYYCQGFHLALEGEPLFSNPILAWDHGPVVREIYDQYRKYGSNAIPVESITRRDFNGLSKEQKGIIEEVYDVYGQFSAWKLRNMTHDEYPWASTGNNEIITQDKLKSYFKTQLQ